MPGSRALTGGGRVGRDGRQRQRQRVPPHHQRHDDQRGGDHRHRRQGVQQQLCGRHLRQARGKCRALYPHATMCCWCTQCSELGARCSELRAQSCVALRSYCRVPCAVPCAACRVLCAVCCVLCAVCCVLCCVRVCVFTGCNLVCRFLNIPFNVFLRCVVLGAGVAKGVVPGQHVERREQVCRRVRVTPSPLHVTRLWNGVHTTGV